MFIVGLILMAGLQAVSAPAEAFPFDGVSYKGVNVHDPSIVFFDGTYVMLTTSGNEFAPLWTSTDLKSWSQQGPILREQPAWLKAAIPEHKSIWAPDPLRVGKALRVYYCASKKFGSNTSFIGLAENPSFDPKKPLVGWIDKGLLIESDAGTSNFNAIDPDVETGPDGRQWMVYGSYWSGIYQREIDPTTGKLKDPTAAAIPVASNTMDHGNPLEAATQCFHDGYYYLFVTYGLAAQGIRSTYRMMVGRAKQPTGPYLGFDGTPMTEGGHTDLLKSSSPMIAPGGGNVFQDSKGSWMMAYHYYDSRQYWVRDLWGRPTLQVRPIVWGADGWPLPGLPVGSDGANIATAQPTGTWLYQSNFGNVDTISLLRDGTIQSEDRTGTWSCQKDKLNLHWAEHRNSPAQDEALKLEPHSAYAVGRNSTGEVVRLYKSSKTSGTTMSYR